ncbi:AI-2E family transporter [Acinetobacter sp. B5B]|uniref:AI-2E family transporter n=1 Tax=Acinetobacter baretiae TaxID=2605383 RepID=UPI0018C29E7B|nr:AI-2E family transporter [Acinetobacter baretiae]MBF7682842.1 AI-2E family transporter [Acinetobacter baretiae]MBF7685464.1 AI-2E family transporter [Acinetobacter baretiae]
MQRYIPSLLHKAFFIGLMGVFLYLTFNVLKYFIVPVVWAIIIAYMTWPIYTWVQKKCGLQRRNLGALCMLLMIFLTVGLPIGFGIVILQQEGQNLFLQAKQQIYAGDFTLPNFVLQLPIIGTDITRLLAELNANPDQIFQNITLWLQGHLSYGRMVVGEITRNLVKLGFTLLSLFFFYRDGQSLLKQFHFALEKVIGERIHHYMTTISDTTRAVVYGIGLTALVQAILAGLSYFVAGVPNPLLLTLMTFVLALIPFGTPVSYGSVAIWLLSQGHIVSAVAVLVWGLCIVSSSDNVIRPLVISGATQIPFLLIMFGVLGGITSFGLIGLFIGPVILAVLLAIWREWIQELKEDT